MTDDLVSWLRAQLGDDERLAQAADGDAVVSWLADYANENGERDAGAHIEHFKPSRALAEVRAKRAILDLHKIDSHGPVSISPTGSIESCRTCVNEFGYCRTVRLLAAVFSDRPGYQEAWKP